MKFSSTIAIAITVSLSAATIPVMAQQGDNITIEARTDIGEAKAKEIALQKVPGKVLSIKKETDDGMVMYEVIVEGKDGKYEVEIDPATGKVLEVEKEGAKNGDDDKYDDDDGDDDDDRHGDDDNNDDDDENDDDDWNDD